MKTHWEGLLAADFFTTGVLCRDGQSTFYTLFVIDLRSRLVHPCGTTVSLNGQSMQQVARFEGGAPSVAHLQIR